MRRKEVFNFTQLSAATNALDITVLCINYCCGEVTQFKTSKNISECTNLGGHFLASKHSL